MKIYIFILILLFFLFFLKHYYYNQKVSEEYNIIQINNPSKTILEENIEKKSPLIITKSIKKWKSIIKELSYNNIDKYFKNEYILISNSKDNLHKISFKKKTNLNY